MYCVRARVRVCISDLLQNIMWLSGVETLMPIALLLFPHKKQQHCSMSCCHWPSSRLFSYCVCTSVPIPCFPTTPAGSLVVLFCRFLVNSVEDMRQDFRCCSVTRFA